MKYNRNRFAERDSNHEKVAGWYRALFCHVVDTSMVKFGFPDFVISCRGADGGVWALVEVKTADGTLTPSQERFIREAKAKVEIVSTQDDVLAHVQRMRRKQAAC